MITLVCCTYLIDKAGQTGHIIDIIGQMSCLINKIGQTGHLIDKVGQIDH